MRKMETCISGVGVRSSTNTKTAMRTSPPTMQSQINGLPHPHRTDCWSPKMLSAMPAAMRTAPR